jgi:D-alanyl-D-alanine carboxypeptidase (penicillin-binding protein 5/6)
MRTGFGLLIAFLLVAGFSAEASAATKHTTAKPAATAAAAAPATIRGVPVIYREPYLGMIAVDGATGKALAEDNADVTVYPASVIKLMTLFVVEDRIQQGTMHLTDTVEVNAEASHMGGTRVFLKEHEVFTVEELIYALMMQSANDCALALAVHVAGSQPAFVELMNQKAQALGMTHSHFYSCHGLPPTPPRKPSEVDVSTPRDLAILGRALVASHPEILQYTSCIKRTFRPGPKHIDMLNHNHRLMASCPGVDGLKTGYFDAAGYSSIVTAKRNDRRVFVVVAGSGQMHKDLGKARDRAAAEALNRAFAALPPLPPPPPPAPATNAAAVVAQPDPTTFTPEPPKKSSSNWRTAALVLGVVVLGALGVAAFFAWRRRQNDGLPLAMDGDLSRPRRPLPPLRK